MNIHLNLRDISLGSIDAKNELLRDTQQEQEQFERTYFIPENFPLEDFTNRRRYFVCGAKGTGKTALLRYLAIQMENGGTETSFILFKTDITFDERKDFARAARTSFLDKEDGEFPDPDFEIVWRWFAYRHLVHITKTRNLSLFANSGIWNEFLDLVESPTEQNAGFISRLIPRLKKGQIELSQESKLQLDFEFGSERKIIDFRKLVRRADELFAQLEPGDASLVVFFDELELTLGHSKQYERDMLLIRDLICTIEKLNKSLIARGIPLHFYCAVRSEVSSAISAIGKEINKALNDFGSTIAWHTSNVDPAQHALMRILLRRIAISEEQRGGKGTSDKDLVAKYFPQMIHQDASAKFVIDQTWYRPRDIVRLFTLIQQQHPDATRFEQYVFDSTKKRYSADCWIELSEELSAKYSVYEIAGIQHLLNAIQRVFSFSDFSARCEKLKEIYDEVSDLMKHHKPATILGDLFRVGAIVNRVQGAYGTSLRAAFKGDPSILLDRSITVHRPLWPHFTIS